MTCAVTYFWLGDYRLPIVTRWLGTCVQSFGTRNSHRVDAEIPDVPYLFLSEPNNSDWR